MERGAHHNLAMLCNSCSSGGGEVSDEKTLNGIPESLLIRVNRAPEHWAIEAWKEYKEKYGEWPSAEKINAMRNFVYTAQQLHDFKTPLTKDEKIKEEQEVVKSRSTRHALERVLKAVQLHLPPDGISEREAMGMIIEAVDPMPDDFDSEKCIKEVMELVINAVCAGIDYGKETEAAPDKLKILYLQEILVESKLRELIQ